MPPKKNKGTTTREDKKRLSPAPSASGNGGDLANNPPQWFISEMEKGIQRIESMIEGRLTRLSETMEKIVSDNEAIGNRVKCVEGKQSEFDDSLFTHIMDPVCE